MSSEMVQEIFWVWAVFMLGLITIALVTLTVDMLKDVVDRWRN